jgi:hypothetical protein
MILDIPRGKGTQAKSYAKQTVIVKQHLDGSWSVCSKDNTTVVQYPPTMLREPIRQWKKRNSVPKGEERREAKNIEQVYSN